MEMKRDRKAWIEGNGAVRTAPQTKRIDRAGWCCWARRASARARRRSCLRKPWRLSPFHGRHLPRRQGLDACGRTPALTAALDYMRRGDLVPDETVLALVAERVGCLRCEGGFLLDGFPRTVAQAEALEKLLAGEKLQLDAVLSYDLPLEQVVARLSGGARARVARPYSTSGPATQGRRRLRSLRRQVTSAKTIVRNPSACGWKPMNGAPRRWLILSAQEAAGSIAAEGSPEEISSAAACPQRREVTIGSLPAGHRPGRRLRPLPDQQRVPAGGRRRQELFVGLGVGEADAQGDRQQAEDPMVTSQP